MTHKDLEVWQKAIAFVTDIYNQTSSFPKEEMYGLVSQLRRSAVSIPSNIAEGAARQSNKVICCSWKFNGIRYPIDYSKKYQFHF